MHVSRRLEDDGRNQFFTSVCTIDVGLTGLLSSSSGRVQFWAFAVLLKFTMNNFKFIMIIKIIRFVEFIDLYTLRKETAQEKCDGKS